jgi:CMP-N-acetylneuraminic acid synthetase
MSKKILGLVPARYGSKGLPRKNIREIAGKPLLHYALEAAKGSRLISRVVVSTESNEVAENVHALGCEVIKRPEELAQDDTPMVPVVRHALHFLADREGYCPDITVLLQPTAPLRNARHIDEALQLLMSSRADSVVSVARVPGHYNPHWQFLVDRDGLLSKYSDASMDKLRTRRQALPDTYTRNGAVYAFHTELVLEHNSLYGDRCIAYIMPPEESVNIDSQQDLWLAERYLQRRQNETA